MSESRISTSKKHWICTSDEHWTETARKPAELASDIQETETKIANLRLQLELYRLKRAKMLFAARRMRFQSELRRAKRRIKKLQG
jgi:hypothetical protein